MLGQVPAGAVGARPWEHAQTQKCLGRGYARLVTMRGVVAHSDGTACKSGKVADERLLQTLCEEGNLDKAIDFLPLYEQQGSVPIETYSYVVRACIKKKSLGEAKRVLAHIAKSGLESHFYLGESLVDMLVQCGSFTDALELFERISRRTVFSWTVIISAHTKQGQHQQALKLYGQMQAERVRPNKHTFRSLVKSCSVLGDVEVGRRVHADAVRYGCSSDMIVGTSLIDMYVKCGCMADAVLVFDTLHQRDVVCWNVMIMGYTQKGEAEAALQVFSRMQAENLQPDGRTFVSVLKACGLLAVKETATFVDGQWIKASSLEQGRIIHAAVEEMGCMSSPFVGSTLLHMYANCGSIAEAREVFNALTHRDVVSWNAMIAGYAQQGQGQKALQLYAEMQAAGVTPDNRTFVSLLKSCADLAAKEECTHGNDVSAVKADLLRKGMSIHKELRARGYESDVFIGNTLVHMYANCGSLVEAQKVFDLLSNRDVVSWNAMIAGFSQQGRGQQALHLYDQMRKDGVMPDDWTYVSLLSACSSLAAAEEKTYVNGQALKLESLRKGTQIHADITQSGRGSVAHVCSALVHMYASCGNIQEARSVFDTLRRCDVVIWNTMIAGYVQQEQNENALHLYNRMHEEGVTPNESTFLSTVKACGNAGALGACAQIDCDIAKSGFQQNSNVANSLIHAYGKCGNMAEARRVFDSLRSPDAVTWNTLIGGYSRRGEYSASFQCYEEMRKSGTRPDAVTFVSLLSACSHAGMVEKGLGFFESMTTEYGIVAEMEHYVCMVDLLGRAGLFNKVEDLLSKMPMQPDSTLWVSLLGACRKYVNVDLGRRAFEGAVSMDPGRSAPYALMSNLYSHALRWDDVKAVDDVRASAVAWKKPGQSWIEHKQRVHTFKVGKNNHERIDKVYSKVRELNAVIDEAAVEVTEPGVRDASLARDFVFV